MPKVGDILEGKVIKILKHKGAKVKLEKGPIGFLHISEISDEYVKNVFDYLKGGQEIKVKVITVKDRNIGLSIRKLNDNEESRRIKFEASLNRFLKESGEKQKQIAKSLENKRGGKKKKGKDVKK